MDFLLSWSGHASHEIATFLRTWLPDVLPGCKPWVSSEDIAKGKPWRDELRGLLDRAKVSIVVITPDNLRSPWLYYEAGWIAAKMEEALVCPYLVGVPMKLVTGSPLADFQCTEADKTDTLRLIRSLHAAIGEPHAPALLEGNYKNRWPQLRNKLEKVAEEFTVEEDPVAGVEPPLASLLSPEARKLLLAAGADPERAPIVQGLTSGGYYLHAGTGEFVQSGNARSEALWKAAVNELESYRLIEPMSYERSVFEITHKGWAVYDQLTAEGAQSA